jgi:hypothetical protein
VLNTVSASAKIRLPMVVVLAISRRNRIGLLGPGTAMDTLASARWAITALG